MQSGHREATRARYEMRRPAADSLRDGLHELRLWRRRVHYRMLYFFHGRGVAVLVHGLTKEGPVPDQDIERALRRKHAFEADPEGHAHQD